MTFEQEFPSLKGFTARWSEYSDEGCVESGMFFGSLHGEGPVVHVFDVEEFCLDKQRVRDVIEKIRKKHVNAIHENSDIVCDEIVEELGL